MQAISSYRGNRPTNTNTQNHKQTHRQDRLQYSAPQPARSITSRIISYEWPFWISANRVVCCVWFQRPTPAISWQKRNCNVDKTAEIDHPQHLNSVCFNRLSLQVNITTIWCNACHYHFTCIAPIWPSCNGRTRNAVSMSKWVCTGPHYFYCPSPDFTKQSLCPLMWGAKEKSEGAHQNFFGIVPPTCKLLPTPLRSSPCFRL